MKINTKTKMTPDEINDAIRAQVNGEIAGPVGGCENTEDEDRMHDAREKRFFELVNDPSQWTFMRIKAKTKMTLAMRLLKQIRGGQERITNHYWGTAADYNNGRYEFWDYCPKFGGMGTIHHRIIPAREIIACGDEMEKLVELIKPRVDTSPGDPQNYAPHSSEPCPLKI